MNKIKQPVLTIRDFLKKGSIALLFFTILLLNACAIETFASTPLIESGNDFVLYYDGTTLFSWGDNQQGQLGVGDTYQFSSAPVEVQLTLDEGEFIIDLEAGYAHAGILTSLGRVFMWGDNQYHQVSQIETSVIYEPIEMSVYDSKKIQSLALGGYHTGYVTDDRDIILFGLNTSGQLGNQNKSMFEHQVIYEYSDYRDVQIRLGSEHSAFILDQEIYMFGSNFNGQLGLGNIVNQHTPTLLMTLEENEVLKTLELGSGITIVSTNQKTYGFGKTVYGIISEETDNDQFTPLLISRSELNNDFMTSISFGYGHATYQTSSGTYFNVGNNTLYQIGLSEQKIYADSFDLSNHPILKGQNILDIKNGGFYQIILTSDGGIYATGYSDFGAIGDSIRRERFEKIL